MPASQTPLPSTPLVSTQWLADHLGSDQLLVVDATVYPSEHGYVTGHEQYVVDGHVPGAVFADLVDDFSAPDGAYPFTRPSDERLAAAASALGITDGTTVVIYDSQVGQWASRLWWLLRGAGFDAHVLDGGFTAWRNEGRATETGHVEPTPASFTLRPRPELWVDKEYVEGVLSGAHAAALVCAVPPKEFSGEVASGSRPGHIPGSISAPSIQLVDRATRVALPQDELRQLFGSALDAPQVVVYCKAGIAATAAALHLATLGANVAVYDGSLNEWTADPDAALEVTAA